MNISGIKSSLPKVNTLAITCTSLLLMTSNVNFIKSLAAEGIEDFSIAWSISPSSTRLFIKIPMEFVSAPILFIASKYNSKWLVGLLFWSISLSSPRTISLINLLDILSLVGVHGVFTHVNSFWSALTSDIKSQTAKTCVSINFAMASSEFNFRYILWFSKSSLVLEIFFKSVSMLLIFK